MGNLTTSGRSARVTPAVWLENQSFNQFELSTQTSEPPAKTSPFSRMEPLGWGATGVASDLTGLLSPESRAAVSLWKPSAFSCLPHCQSVLL